MKKVKNIKNLQYKNQKNNSFLNSQQCKILHEKNNHSKSNQCCIGVILVYGLKMVAEFFYKTIFLTVNDLWVSKLRKVDVPCVSRWSMTLQE
jgi:hypothetical protein